MKFHMNEIFTYADKHLYSLIMGEKKRIIIMV